MNETLNGWAQRHPVTALLVLVIRMVLVAFGVVLMAAAVPVGIVTPFLPVGIPLFLFGLIVVAAASKTLHHHITRFLRRFPWLWRRISFAFGEKREPAE